MNERKGSCKPESPAERLGILYISSFFMIALLTGFSQYYVLRELSWRSTETSSILRVLSDCSLDRPMSLSGMSVLVETEPSKRQVLLKSFSGLLEEKRGETRLLAADFSTRIKSKEIDSGSAELLRKAKLRRASAIASGEQFLSLLTSGESSGGLSRNALAHLKTIHDEEAAAAAAVGEFVEASGLTSVERFSQLRRFEYKQYLLILIVLVLEGLFVVNPAVSKIRQFMNNLERSNKGLKSYAQRLEWSNKELQDFASVASHDLQEPLRKVQAFTDRLKSRSGSALDAQGRDHLDRVQNAAARMQSLINDLLTYSRVATKAQPFVLTNVTTITKEVISDLEALIDQVDGTVEIGDLPQIDADPLQVRQLMQNLIGNALKYKRPSVSPVVKITAIHPFHDPAAFQSGNSQDFCRILVEDNGIGFEEIYSEKIFTIFQRLHGRTEYEGTGVGLAVCRKIAERHGGTITANSTPGQGSVFTVTLPMRHKKEEVFDERAA